MTKVDIVEGIYEKVGFSKKEVAKIVEYIFDIIKDTLIKEDKIKISGFGNFVVRKRGRGGAGTRRRGATSRSLREGS